MMGTRPSVAHTESSPLTTSATAASTSASLAVGSLSATYASFCAREKMSSARDTKSTYWSNTFATLPAAFALTLPAARSSSIGLGRDDEKLRWYAS